MRSVTGRLEYLINDLAGQIRYDVQVRAVNAIGEGPWSATASGTPVVQPVCENSNVVPNASSNPQLVADCETLLALKDTLRGTGALNWSGSIRIQSWNGVRIGGSPLRVTEFRVQDNMTGQIPPELGNLSSLEILYLWSDQLTGTIPARLSGAVNLEELSFSDNRLQGSIPTSFGRMSKLTSLAMARNRLTGAIPPELENLANLTNLMLSGNQLTGCIPAALKKVQENDLANLVLPDCAAPAPDLVVDTPTVSTGAPAAGAQFTLNAAVRNQGNEASVFTTLRYYQSTDQTITTGDTSIGTDSVSSLNASASGDESISVTEPDTPGTYHYGACADSVSGESDTTNNCSASVEVTVSSAPDPKPSGSAVTGSVTSCEGEQLTPGIDSYRISIAGIVTASRAVANVRVEGTFNGSFVGIDLVGDMEAGEIANFSITGYVSESVGTCGADVEWLESN